VLLYQDSGQTHALLVESPEWYQWLETASTFAFESSQGSFTARKERSGNKRGGWHWKAYRRRGGKLYRAYLGQSAALTLSHLHAVAAQLAAQDEESTVKSLPALQDEAHFSYAQFPREHLFLGDRSTGESSADMNRTVKVPPRQRLSAERIRRRWSQLEVADQLGTTPGNVSRWERGITSPGTYFRNKLCELFGSSAQELGLTWGESDDSPGHTLARLEHIAGILSAQSEDQVLLPASLAAGTDGELKQYSLLCLPNGIL